MSCLSIQVSKSIKDSQHFFLDRRAVQNPPKNTLNHFEFDGDFYTLLFLKHLTISLEPLISLLRLPFNITGIVAKINIPFSQFLRLRRTSVISSFVLKPKRLQIKLKKHTQKTFLSFICKNKTNKTK